MAGAVERPALEEAVGLHVGDEGQQVDHRQRQAPQGADRVPADLATGLRQRSTSAPPHAQVVVPAGRAPPHQPHHEGARGVDVEQERRRKALEPRPRGEGRDHGRGPKSGSGDQAMGGPQHGRQQEDGVHAVDGDQGRAAEGVGHGGQRADGARHAEPAHEQVHEPLAHQEQARGSERHAVPGRRDQQRQAEGRQEAHERERAERVAGTEARLPQLVGTVAHLVPEAHEGREVLGLVGLDRRLDGGEPPDRVAVGRGALQDVDRGIGGLAGEGLGHQRDGGDDEHRERQVAGEARWSRRVGAPFGVDLLDDLLDGLVAVRRPGVVAVLPDW